MKTMTLFLLPMLLLGCSTMPANNKQQQADKARVEAEQAGHSGPLYDHYEACLNTHWRKALAAGDDESVAYDAGVAECGYELTLLCDYYGVDSCYQDAQASSRLLYYLMQQDLRAEID